MEQLIKMNVWRLLEAHAAVNQKLNQRLFKNNKADQQSTHAIACGIQIDYSCQHLTENTWNLLFSLADSCFLREKIHALMRGDPVNFSEQKPALHTALRMKNRAPVWVNGQNIMDNILSTQNKMRVLAQKIREGTWYGHSGKPITSIVNIGMGGSDLGPRFCLGALSDIAADHLSYDFISDADPNSFKRAVEKLSPDTTLFIIASKSFETQETLFNMEKAIAWIGDEHVAQHFIAITANVERASQMKIKTILPIWDWVGGRYSLCSAINFITVVAIGYEAFSQLLAGAFAMDQHFQNNPYRENLPVLLALLGIWNNNFLNIHNLLMLTYAKQLDRLVPYVQQLDMESNGKSFDNRMNAIQHATAPLVWGGGGSEAQHSYYQLLCQGTHKVTADFITTRLFDDEMINRMCFKKMHILASGASDYNLPSHYISGGMPLNHIQLDDFSPHTVGSLIALYEHKTYVQGVIWNLNSFDQPGIEMAKRYYACPSNLIIES